MARIICSCNYFRTLLFMCDVINISIIRNVFQMPNIGFTNGRLAQPDQCSHTLQVSYDLTSAI